jgi:hypothetical protein
VVFAGRADRRTAVSGAHRFHSYTAARFLCFGANDIIKVLSLAWFDRFFAQRHYSTGAVLLCCLAAQIPDISMVIFGSTVRRSKKRMQSCCLGARNRRIPNILDKLYPRKIGFGGRFSAVLRMASPVDRDQGLRNKGTKGRPLGCSLIPVGGFTASDFLYLPVCSHGGIFSATTCGGGSGRRC